MVYKNSWTWRRISDCRNYRSFKAINIKPAGNGRVAGGFDNETFFPQRFYV